jgi:hypothetical protein
MEPETEKSVMQKNMSIKATDPKRNRRLFNVKLFSMFGLVMMFLALIIGIGFLHIYWGMPKTGNASLIGSKY